jgi:N-acetylglucosamine kinase-like BadF-type ATPase
MTRSGAHAKASRPAATAPPALLGVDGGGTSTIAWLADAGGRVLGTGRAGPSNAKAVGAEAARQALGAAIAAAFAAAGIASGPVDAACLGMAGFDRPDDRRLLTGWAEHARWADRLVLVNDGDLVLAAGTPQRCGVAVIAGTGSIAVGRTAAGRTARAGGWGPLIGDEGSAYAIALAALRLVARRADGREPDHGADDPLTCRLCDTLAVARPAEIVTALYAPGFDRVRIAGLAPVVLAAAGDDPALVPLLLEPAGRALAEMAAAVARALDWREGPLPLALAGSFLLAAAEVSEALCTGLAQIGYAVEAAHVSEPVRGALVLARHALEGERNR